MKKNLEQIIANCFREVTEIGVFDIVKGNMPIPPTFAMLFKDVPNYIYNYLMQEHYGCCFVFSFALCHLLHENGVESKIVYSKEGKDIRVSVLYKIDGKLYIANPVEDVDYFTKNRIEQQDRKNCYKKLSASYKDEEGLIRNNSTIPIKEFVQSVGGVAVVGNPYESDEQFKASHIQAVNVLLGKIEGDLIDENNVDDLRTD